VFAVANGGPLTTVLISLNLKVCDDGTLTQILRFWTLSIVLFLFKTQRFGDWILPPSSGNTNSVGPNLWSIQLKKKSLVVSLKRLGAKTN
jgi:hypothetical protein